VSLSDKKCRTKIPFEYEANRKARISNYEGLSESSQIETNAMKKANEANF
jgi:hypothetical protein